MPCNQILAISFLVSGNDLDTNLMIYCPESSFKNLLTAQIYVFCCGSANSENLFFKGYVSLSCNWLYLTGRNFLFSDKREWLRGFGIKIHFSTFNFYVLDRGYICMYTYITPVTT